MNAEGLLREGCVGADNQHQTLNTVLSTADTRVMHSPITSLRESIDLSIAGLLYDTLQEADAIRSITESLCSGER